MKQRRDTWLVISLFLVMVIVAVLLGVQRTRQAELPAFYSQSNQPNGARALRLWLEAQQFTVIEDTSNSGVFTPPQEAHLIFMLEPDPFTPDEFDALDNWLKAGNTLVAAGNQYGSLGLARHFDYEPVFHATPLTEIHQFAPLLISPRLPADFKFSTDISYSNLHNADFVPYLVAADAPVMLSFHHGLGRVILLSSAQPFSNQALKETGNAELVLNILNLAPFNSPIWFDEWHHGFRSVQNGVIGPEDWLRYTSVGHAILFSLLAVFLVLLLQGQNFGRPIPILRELRRRAPLEYISAIANLKRRADHRKDTLAFYHSSLKRGLGKRYRLDPSIPDEQYVTKLGVYNPQLDQAALLSLLTRLNAKTVTESELLKLAAETAAWLKDLPANL